MTDTLKKLLLAAVLVFLAVVSFFPVAERAAAPETYARSAAAIDDKSETVLKLTASSTLLSAGISALPGDAATPIAEKMADFTEYFLLILCVLYAEKYLLTVMGTAAFKILFPAAFLLLGVGLFRKKETLRPLAMKLILFAMAAVVAIPLSLKASDAIYRAYESSITAAITEAEDLTEKTGQLTDSQGAEQRVVQDILSRISETASTLSDKAANSLNRFVESLAVLIVTSCIIPILVLLFFVWLLKALAGITVPMPAPRARRRRKTPPEAPGEEP